MHKWAKEIADCMKDKVKAMGIDNINKEDLEEFCNWSKIVKNIAEFDYYYTLIEAMHESEYGEDYDEKGPLRKYCSGSHEYRRRYYEPINWDRDMDINHGRMYYPMYEYRDNNMPSGTMYNGNRDRREGRNGNSRRMYMETKELHPSNTMEDKQLGMQGMERFTSDLEADILEMTANGTPEENQLLKTKLINMGNKIK